MTSPFHQYGSVPLATAAAAVHERLAADPRGAIATATGAALSQLEPLVRSWGLAPSALPAVTTHPTGPDTVGSVEFAWSGNEDETAWPALRAHVMVVPDHPANGARIVLVSPRSPGSELMTRRLDGLHRRRIVNVAVQGFLHTLAAHLAHPGTVPGADTESVPAGEWATGPAISPGVTTFDRRPFFLHAMQAVSVDPDELARRLASDSRGLAAAVTKAAMEGAAVPLAAGPFRSAATPTVHVEQPTAGQLGVLRLRWESDEDATGWPGIRLSLVVEAAPEGSRLVVVSTREPGFDLSVNQVDKLQRDQVLRELGPHVAAAVLRRVVPTPRRTRELVGVGS